MKSKILLQINSVINSGSTGRIAEEIGQLAIASGWESYIAYGRESNRPSQSHKIKIGNDWDNKWHGLQTRLLDNHALGWSSRKATQNLIAEIEKIKPDIIHLHNLHGYYLNVEVLFNYLGQLNTPIIWTLHDCWAFTGHCAYFDYVGCEKWKTGCYKCPITKGYPSSHGIDRSRKNYKDKKRLFNWVKNMTLVPVSGWLGNFLKDSFLNQHPIRIINNGVDTEIFSPSLSKKNDKHCIDDKFILLGVASIWDERKGLNDFIKLSEKIDEKYKIILVGLTEKQIATLPPNILGIARTESVEQLAELYSLADIFINPTYEDNFPTTNLEALACGTL